MKKILAFSLALLFSTNLFASSVPGKKPFPYDQGVTLAKNVLYMNARELSAGAGLGTLWSDTFKDSTQINAGASSGYTYRGSSNFDVIRLTSGVKNSSTTENDLVEIISNVTNSERGASQSFTPTENYTASQVTFKLIKIGSPTGNLVCKIYNHSSDMPSGAALATSTTTLSIPSISTSYTEYNFDFAGLALTNGTKYVVSIETSGAYTGDGANHINVRKSSSSVYASHQGGQKSNTDNWSNLGGADLYFKVSATAPATAVVQSVVTTFGASVSSLMVFVDMTLNTGSLSLVRVSANNGTTWKTVTTQLEELVPLGHSGTQVIVEVTFTGDAELEFWGASA